MLCIQQSTVTTGNAVVRLPNPPSEQRPHEPSYEECYLMTQSKVRNVTEIHTLSEQFSFNVWLIREGRGRGNKGPVPLPQFGTNLKD